LAGSVKIHAAFIMLFVNTFFNSYFVACMEISNTELACSSSYVNGTLDKKKKVSLSGEPWAFSHKSVSSNASFIDKKLEQSRKK